MSWEADGSFKKQKNKKLWMASSSKITKIQPCVEICHRSTFQPWGGKRRHNLKPSLSTWWCQRISGGLAPLSMQSSPRAKGGCAQAQPESKLTQWCSLPLTQSQQGVKTGPSTVGKGGWVFQQSRDHILWDRQIPADQGFGTRLAGLELMS